MQAELTKKMLDALNVTERTYVMDIDLKGFLAIVQSGGATSLVSGGDDSNRVVPLRRWLA